MYLHTVKKWWFFLNQGRTLALLVSLVFLGVIVYYFTDIVTYVLIAWVISLIGSPIMNLLKKIRIKHWTPGSSLRAAVTLLLIVVIIGGMGFIFIPMIMTQAASLGDVNYLAIAQSLEEPLNNFNDRLAEWGLTKDRRAPSEQVLEAFKEWFEPAFVGNFFSSTLALLSTLFIGGFSTLFIAFFFLREDGLFKETMSSLVPNEFQQSVVNVIDQTSELLSRYFGGVVIQIVMIATFLSIFLSLAGVSNALLIGVFAAFFNVIPYVGPIIGGIFGLLMTITSSLDLNFYTEMVPLLYLVLGIFAVAQLIDNFFIQPFILGNRVLAHPLEIFILVLVAGKIGGIPGMILAIPAYTVLRVIARVFLSEFSLVKKLTRRMEEEIPDETQTRD